MENEKTKNSAENGKIKKHILEAVKTGRLYMRPKWHFVLKTALVILWIFMIGLALLYLAGFVFFSLRENGVWFVPVFGARGWFEFLISLPWILVAVAVLFIVILEILVRRFEFGIRLPLLYTALGVIFLVIVGGAITWPLHRRFFRAAEERRLPFIGKFYRGFGAPHLNNIHVGIISQTTEDGFMLEDRHRNETLHVIVNPQTAFPLGTEFSGGDEVIVFGKRADDTIQALGIRKIVSESGTSTAPLLPSSGENFRFRWTP